MKLIRWMLPTLLVAGLGLAGCGTTHYPPNSPAPRPSPAPMPNPPGY